MWAYKRPLSEKYAFTNLFAWTYFVDLLTTSSTTDKQARKSDFYSKRLNNGRVENLGNETFHRLIKRDSYDTLERSIVNTANVHASDWKDAERNKVEFRCCRFADCVDFIKKTPGSQSFPEAE